MKSSYPIWSWAFAALSLALLGAWGFLAYEGFKLREAAAVATAAEAERSERAAYLSTVKGALRQSEADLAAIDARFVDRDDVPGYITEIEAEADRAGVAVSMGAIDLETPSDAPVGALRLGLSVSGSWQQVIGFVAHLESMPYASSVTSLSLSKRVSENGTSWSAAIDMLTQVANK